MLAGQAICKDCGNGTLNNLLNEQFDECAACLRCGSSHVDGDLFFDEDESGLEPEAEEDEQDENGDPYSDEDYEKEVGA